MAADGALAALRDAQKKLGQNIVTPILRVEKFYPANEKHQNYYKKHPLKYGYYRKGCGRDARVAQLWGSAVKH